MIEEYKIEKPNFDDIMSLWKFAELHPCKHNYTIARGVQSNGVIMYKEICLYCGDVRGGAIAYSKLTDKQKQNAIDYSLKESLRESYKSKLEKLYQDEFGISPTDYYDRTFLRREEFWLWYSNYLKSDVWQRRRQAVMRRARGICEACQVASATQVHHLTYAHVGREPLFELVAVCTKCHEQITAWDRE